MSGMKKVRGAIENAIIELKGQRDAIDAELQMLVKMNSVGVKQRTKKFVRRPTVEVALEMLSKQDEVTPAELAERARVSGAAASAALSKLVEDKKAKKLGRGVFSK